MLPKIDTIIFISNPFGFGPAGKAIILIQELRRKWPGKIVYVASQKCLDILPNTLKNTIDVIETDERDEKKLTNILSEFKSAMAVVVLNRTAVKVARDIDMKTFFVDSLSWMWKEIPSEYLSADAYYYYNVFGEQGWLKNLINARPIPPILGTLPKRDMVNGCFLLHIGGFSNPFAKDNHVYLYLLADLLNHTNSKHKITIAGGRSGIEFLSKTSIQNKNIIFNVVERNLFLDKVAKTERFITTSGSTAVFEAFAMGTPTSFLPPTNLSQWRQLKLLLSLNAAPLEMQWERYLETPKSLYLISEQDSSKEFLSLPEMAMKNESVMKQMRGDFNNIFSQIADFGGQRSLIEKAADGSSEIISGILNIVSPSGN